jgi:hypothetical protein
VRENDANLRKTMKIFRPKKSRFSEVHHHFAKLGKALQISHFQLQISCSTN